MDQSGELDVAWHELLETARRTDDYNGFLKLCRKRRKLARTAPPKRSRTIRLAVLGTATTDLLIQPLELALDCVGLGCEIYNAPFDSAAHEMLDPGSPTVEFGPDVVLVVNSPLSFRAWPDPSDRSDIEVRLDEATRHWLDLCQSLRQRIGCEFIFDNFHLLPHRVNGNLSSKFPGDANRFLTRLNLSLAEDAPGYVHINDVSWLANYHGLERWVDLRYWHHAKTPVGFSCVTAYVRNVANILAAIYGKPRKVLVLDLDDTLWGGVIGDDDLEGISIGQGTPGGEAFLAFQHYILDLKRRGVLLAVCSKNEIENARLPFEKHPEMALRLDDFVAFSANWDPKPANLLSMANQLNLGVDSFVFVDDNPAERELMRRELPQVATLELPEDPAGYIGCLDASATFEVTATSAEDADRTTQYQKNAEREDLKITLGDYDEYLRSLDQRARIRPFESHRIDRIVQLVNKTNQFNLTTFRKTRSEIETMMADEDSMTCHIELTDKFGDNGLIAVLFGKWKNDRLCIDEWLMSCRVLKRGVEDLTCNHVVELARVQGKQFVTGSYIPTAKNKMVADLYKRLGFQLMDESSDGTMTWRLRISDYAPVETTIDVVDD